MAKRDGKGENKRKASAIKQSVVRPCEWRLLLYRIAQWRIEGDEKGERLTEDAIAQKLHKWAPKHIREEAYNQDGDITARWVGERFKNAIEHNYVKLGTYSENALADDIRDLLPPFHPKIIVAPDQHELQRYVWETLDDSLIKAVKEARNREVIIGVSGGQTLLGLARRVSELTDLRWWSIPADDRKKVKVCSLTSGGIPSDIAALSDTVAGTVGTALGISARGLLGPAWFKDNTALEAFRNQPHVAEHMDMVKRADIIVTSVGNLCDPSSLMARLLTEQGQGDFLEKLEHPADILYMAYDGLSGKPKPLPKEVAGGLFSVIDLEELLKIEQRFVVVSGAEKGRHALPGVLRKKIATHVCMDQACALGCIETLKKRQA